MHRAIRIPKSAFLASTIQTPDPIGCECPAIPYNHAHATEDFVMSNLDLASMRIHDLMEREWIATNGIGGYASCSIAGINTRKYHGLLVAAMQPPLKRMVILSRVDDAIVTSGGSYPLSSCEYPGAIHPDGHRFLRAFSHEPFPRWAYQDDGWTIERNVRLVQGQNTVVLSYTLLAADRPMDLEIKPLFALRGIHDLMYQWNGRMDAKALDRGCHNHLIPAGARTPDVYFSHDGSFQSHANWYLASIYRREIERGYSGLEDVWTPGVIRWTLEPGKSAHFICSTESIDLEDAVYSLGSTSHTSPTLSISASPISANEDVKRTNEAIHTLCLATRKFVARDAKSRTTLLARLPWSPVLVRDALIGFAGTLLIPRRFPEARQLLETLFDHLRDGLLPSSFPEDGSAPVYTAADTSLWLVHAADQYVRYNGDESALRSWIEPVSKIISSFIKGTTLGVSCDADGLIVSRMPGVPATWMDAKCADWVITPRYGRAVEMQALWYNALRILSSWNERLGDTKAAGELSRTAMRTKASFNERFWSIDNRCLFDVVLDKGADASIRPNQLLSMSLSFPVLAPERHATVLEKVRQSLLTPFGVRTLSPEDPSYQGKYVGDVVARDRAYHQGCAFAWLLGPYVSALIRTYGQSDSVLRQARDVLAGVIGYMQAEGVGQLCELFDGDPPHRPGGAIASIAATGEILRVYVEDILDYKPGTEKRLLSSAGGKR